MTISNEFGELSTEIINVGVAELIIEALTFNNFSHVDVRDNTSDYYESAIAVTPNYVYVTGQTYTHRYDHNLTSGTTYEVRESLFSDQASGDLYEFITNEGTAFSTDSMSESVSSQGGGNQIITEIQPLNEYLTSYGRPITLSQPITVYNRYKNGMFPGSGYIIFYDAHFHVFYHIDLSNGDVTELDYSGIEIPFYNSSSYGWADWGIAEFDGKNYSILFWGNTPESYGYSVIRIILPEGIPHDAGLFDAKPTRPMDHQEKSVSPFFQIRQNGFLLVIMLIPLMKITTIIFV